MEIFSVVVRIKPDDDIFLDAVSFIGIAISYIRDR